MKIYSNCERGEKPQAECSMLLWTGSRTISCQRNMKSICIDFEWDYEYENISIGQFLCIWFPNDTMENERNSISFPLTAYICCGSLGFGQTNMHWLHMGILALHRSRSTLAATTKKLEYLFMTRRPCFSLAADFIKDLLHFEVDSNAPNHFGEQLILFSLENCMVIVLSFAIGFYSHFTWIDFLMNTFDQSFREHEPSDQLVISRPVTTEWCHFICAGLGRIICSKDLCCVNGIVRAWKKQCTTLMMIIIIMHSPSVVMWVYEYSDAKRVNICSCVLYCMAIY